MQTLQTSHRNAHIFSAQALAEIACKDFAAAAIVAAGEAQTAALDLSVGWSILTSDNVREAERRALRAKLDCYLSSRKCLRVRTTQARRVSVQAYRVAAWWLTYATAVEIGAVNCHDWLLEQACRDADQLRAMSLD